jgi:uncharacterized protein
MSPFSRRAFTLSSLAAVPAALSAAGDMPLRRLGRINFQASILGVGAQHLGDEPVEQSLVDRFVAEAIDSGINYFDTAPPYNRSEERLGIALKGKRDKVFLVSKVECTAGGDVEYQLKDTLRKLQTDYLDCVHLHNVGRVDRWPSLDQVLFANDGPLAALRAAKKKGMIRHIGATCHMRPHRAVPVLQTGDIDLFMCSINFVERHIYNFEEKVLPECRKNNIGVIGMKVLGGPVKGGARLMSSEEYNATLRYAWGTPGLAVAILGMRNLEELRQAVAAARAYRPLERDEVSRLTTQGQQMAKVWGPLRGPVV